MTPQAPIDELRKCLRRPPRVPRSTPTLVHNDLAAEHILVDDAGGRITGVIDWSDAAISDPSVAFAGMFHWGGDTFADAVLAAYRGVVDDGLRVRAKFLAVCRGVMDIAFGREFNRPEYVSAGLRASRLCHNPRDLEP